MVAYSFQQRFVAPIRVGLGQIMKDDKGNWLTCESVVEPGSTRAVPFDPYKHMEPEARPKRQTIRAIGKRRHARPGETLQLYRGMRTKQCFKIGEARCTETVPISIAVREHSMSTYINGRHVGGGNLRNFAQADGFEHAEDMLAFWKENHGLGDFKGVLIRWEPLT